MYYDDPLRLAVPYEYLYKALPEPPDGKLLKLFSIALIYFVYLFPILRGLLRLWCSLTLKLLKQIILWKSEHSIFVRHGRRPRQRTRKMPTLYIRAFATSEENTDDNAFSWDTDGIPFVIDNSATGIICNVRKLLVGPLIPTKVTLETAEGLTTKTKFVGTIALYWHVIITSNIPMTYLVLFSIQIRRSIWSEYHS